MPGINRTASPGNRGSGNASVTKLKSIGSTPGEAEFTVRQLEKVTGPTVMHGIEAVLAMRGNRNKVTVRIRGAVYHPTYKVQKAESLIHDIMMVPKVIDLTYNNTLSVRQYAFYVSGVLAKCPTPNTFSERQIVSALNYPIRYLSEADTTSPLYQY